MTTSIVPTEIVTLPIDQIKPPKRKLRKHSPLKIDRINHGLEKYGVQTPILIDKDYRLIDGGAVLEALQSRGETHAQFIRLTHLSSDEVRGLHIHLNKSQEGSIWIEAELAAEVEELLNFELTAADLGLETGEVDRLLQSLNNDDDDAIPELGDRQSTPPTSEEGNIWLFDQAEHRLAVGDCRDAGLTERLTKGEQATMGFTDPPYGGRVNGHVGGKGRIKHREFTMASGEMSKEELGKFLSEAMAPVYDHLRPGGLAYMFMDWRSAALLEREANHAGLETKNWIVWVKPNGGMGSLYRSRHEFILLFRKPGDKSINNVQLGKFGRNRTNVWEYEGANSFGATRDDLANHPTPKPVQMIEDAILDATDRGDTVLDLFGGGGTTMIAAQRCGRRALLCEIDPIYADVTIERYQRIFGIEAVLEETGETYSEVMRRRQAPATTPRHRVRHRARVRVAEIA